ncbi:MULTISPECIES: type II toxin-antitoxin system VapC family toxin [unclassified Rhizobium]|uniref:type II toxin-antitoxin system VapC family toxin n=1 Tax=unclassified Rhizobium TaxID=2613769 RepID=UPI000EAACD9D|nr:MULTISPECIES: type II toxin-antitoxin system VapC family toxin [unclassified Rhizobium]AYG67349.1 type II toxin-antitoxin system VapC family toxin [Rhizobium sp. CCGE531]AYG73743.1 type II toxin-antitoxin system VapC family toxin [Rhizobium sp. CCGE532]
MIVVDTSALIALVQSEAAADQCQAALRNQDQLIISAGTYAEALIVATMRGLREEMDKLFEITVFQIVPVTPERARLAAAAYSLWGKEAHPASLNYGDCFSYATAKEFDCPLLYIGNDFTRTDIVSAISPSQT